MGMEAVQDCWLEEKLYVWQASISIMSVVLVKVLLTAYVCLQNSLQQECYFMQCLTQDIGTAFHSVEDMLRSTFLSDLIKGSTPQIPGKVVTVVPVNQAGVALPDSTQNNESNWLASCVITVHLI